MVKAIQEREKAYAASQLDVDVDLRARSALTCKAIEEKVANVVWVTNELLRQRVEKLTETMAIKEAQLARKQEQTRLEIDRKRAENMLR